VSQGVLPESVLVVTYTVAAARELVDRLAKEHGVTSKLGFVGTLHSFCLRLCREHHVALGLPERIGVVDDEQVEPLLLSIMDLMGEKSSTKVALATLAASKGGDPLTRLPSRAELVVRRYHALLLESGMCDFDMLLHHGLRAAQMAMDGKVPWPYTHVWIDEAQDSSEQDFAIYEAMPCGNKFIVGDDCQSIYAFRDTKVQQFIDVALHKAGKQWTVFKLENNYRSGVVICDTAQRLIEHNVNRIPKVTQAMRPGGSVTVHECDKPADELSYVLEQVQAVTKAPELVCHCGDPIKGFAHEGHTPTPVENEPVTPLTEVAILARTNRLCDAVAQHLRANGVPVKQSKPRVKPGDWRRAKLLLSVIDNPFNDMLVLQLLKATPGQDAVHAKRMAEIEMMSVSEALGWPFGKGDGAVSDVDLLRHGLSADSRERIHTACRELSAGGPWTIPDLLLYLNATEQAQEENGEGVTVCTCHAAKGREFQTVIVVGCEEGVLPSGRKDTDIDEERRLFFVACTRAKDNLLLTYCRERPQNRGDAMPPGPMEARSPSRFITESGLRP
jgi:DNA helicase-2/ATP-dependent DNA helicase PcrA